MHAHERGLVRQGNAAARWFSATVQIPRNRYQIDVCTGGVLTAYLAVRTVCGAPSGRCGFRSGFVCSRRLGTQTPAHPRRCICMHRGYAHRGDADIHHAHMPMVCFTEECGVTVACRPEAVRRHGFPGFRWPGSPLGCQQLRLGDRAPPAAHCRLCLRHRNRMLPALLPCVQSTMLCIPTSGDVDTHARNGQRRSGRPAWFVRLRSAAT